MHINILNVISGIYQHYLNIKVSDIYGVTKNVFRIPLKQSFPLIFKQLKCYDGVILSYYKVEVSHFFFHIRVVYHGL
jgi:hypothetical protein